MIIKDFIRKKREALGISGAEAGIKIGISNSYLSDLERGFRLPSDSVAENIAKAYSMTEQESKDFFIGVGLLKAPEALKIKWEVIIR
jgi:transcriptional regulator with XRE-family HTH domain